MTMPDADLRLLRHFLAALAYRTQKAVRDAPASYAGYRVAPNVRTPHEIVWHMTGVIGYAASLFHDAPFTPDRLDTFAAELQRFHGTLAELDRLLETRALPEGTTAERFLQGPLADAMTHAGQLAMLRRCAGSPVAPENFFLADVRTAHVGPEQAAPRAPKEGWHPDQPPPSPGRPLTEHASEAPEIRTRRLVLTTLRASDAPALHAYRSDPEVCRFQSFEPGSLRDVEKWIEGLGTNRFGTPGTWFQFAIRLRDSGLLVGDFGTRFDEPDARQVEVGFTISPEHQRRGYGAEAVAGVLDHLFGPAGKHRVFASVDPRNEASIALLERVGMRREAHFRESLRFKGEWVDDVVFGILQSEWKHR